MKTLTFIFAVTITLLLASGCGHTNWMSVGEKTDTLSAIIDAEHLIVPSHNTSEGENLFIEIKNTEPNSVKHISINGIPITELGAGDALYGRLTDLIYVIAPIKYQEGWSEFSHYRITQLWVLIEIQIDVVQGKGKQHYILEKWISPDYRRNSKASFQI